MKNLKYIVDPEKKLVVAISSGESDTLVRWVAKQFGVSQEALFNYLTLRDMGVAENLGMAENSIGKALCLDKLFIADVHKGFAKCHPDDEFDVEKGKEIALKKAQCNLKKAKANAIKRWQKEMLYRVGKASVVTFDDNIADVKSRLVAENYIKEEKSKADKAESKTDKK